MKSKKFARLWCKMIDQTASVRVWPTDGRWVYYNKDSNCIGMWLRDCGTRTVVKENLK